MIKEEEFIYSFICKSARDRLQYEFNSKKKRDNAISKFCHNVEDLIDKSKLHNKIRNIDNKEFCDFLAQNSVYVLSSRYINGIEMKLSVAFDYITGEYSAVIICGENRAIIKDEYEGGSSAFYLLKN